MIGRATDGWSVTHSCRPCNVPQAGLICMKAGWRLKEVQVCSGRIALAVEAYAALTVETVGKRSLQIPWGRVCLYICSCVLWCRT